MQAASQLARLCPQPQTLQKDRYVFVRETLDFGRWRLVRCHLPSVAYKPIERQERRGEKKRDALYSPPKHPKPQQDAGCNWRHEPLSSARRSSNHEGREWASQSAPGCRKVGPSRLHWLLACLHGAEDGKSFFFFCHERLRDLSVPNEPMSSSDEPKA